MGEIIPGHSTVGGGSLPEETLPTWLLALKLKKPDRMTSLLRGNNPPIIARIDGDHLVFDPRTILPEQDALFLQALGNLLSEER